MAKSKEIEFVAAPVVCIKITCCSVIERGCSRRKGEGGVALTMIRWNARDLFLLFIHRMRFSLGRQRLLKRDVIVEMNQRQVARATRAKS